MAVAAIGLCRDEADIVRSVLTHIATQVDFIIIADNRSADGTRDILNDLTRELPDLTVVDDPEVGHWQSRKVTALAHDAAARGADWVVPMDQDEVWYSPFGRIADVLAGVSPQWLAAAAALYDHVPTGHDPKDEADPVRRIGWRRRKPGPLPKVACRTRPDLVVHDGNHGAWYEGGTTVLDGQLVVRHYPYRSPEQMVRKARNGAEALAATNLPEDTGAHWRHYNTLMDTYGERSLHSVFYEHFHASVPVGRPDLIFDPAPVQ